MCKAIKRRVLVLDSTEETSREKRKGIFSDYLDRTHLILLGDPGAGKTHTFKVAAEKENAEFLSVRQFLAVGATKKTIYLDGLDEFRSRIDDKNMIIKVIEKLRENNRPSLRLSCRIADWLGKSDLSLFQAYFGEETYVVLSLEPLDVIEMEAILSETSISEPNKFLRNAMNRGLDSLIKNPQTLVMLADVVRRGQWPKRKLDLFENAVKILLSETNSEHCIQGLGSYAASELVEAAGAICAFILISGIAGISLLPDDSEPDYPSYKNVPFENKNLLKACLSRRAFVGCGGETATIIHRTIAEFIGAKWLANQILKGHMIQRVQRLICVNGYPATELRGLHAWLPNFLPENANNLLKKDPYGVLLYGDPASLDLSNRKLFLQALERLSEKDPWFRTNPRFEDSIGSFFSEDMVPELKRILSDKNSNYHLRTIIFEMIQNGQKLDGLIAELSIILTNPETANNESISAFISLLHIGNDGIKVVENSYKTLEKNPSSVRLRSEILSNCFPDYFQIENVFSVYRDLLCGPEDNFIGKCAKLTASIPVGLLPELLDKLSKINFIDCNKVHHVNKSEFCSAFSKMIYRVLKSNHTINANKLFAWLRFLFAIRKIGLKNGEIQQIREWLQSHKDTTFSMFSLHLDFSTFCMDKTWRVLSNFFEITLGAVTYIELYKFIFDQLLPEEHSEDNLKILYNISGSLLFASMPQAVDLFESFFNFANDKESLVETRNRLCQRKIDPSINDRISRDSEFNRQAQQLREQNIIRLTEIIDSIRFGIHKVALGWLAEIYLKDDLRNEINEQLIEAALEGFVVTTKRDDIPSPTEVLSLTIKQQWCPWWQAIVAGVIIELKRNLDISIFSRDLLRSTLSILLECSIRPCGQDVSEEILENFQDDIANLNPDLFRNVFEELARIKLENQINDESFFYLLAHDDKTEPWRSDLAVDLLKEFYNASPNILEDLIIASLYSGKQRDQIKALINTAINDRHINTESLSIWYAVGFLLSYEETGEKTFKYTKNKKQTFWKLRKIIEEIQHFKKFSEYGLTNVQLESIILNGGILFPNTPEPNTYFGDNNPWQASIFIRDCIMLLSTRPDSMATDSLQRLSGNQKLLSYQSAIKHAQAIQLRNRREKEFRQPNWKDVQKFFQNHYPANISDLHALILSLLEIIKKEISFSNTDRSLRESAVNFR